MTMMPDFIPAFAPDDASDSEAWWFIF
jgi:hypothetical protein